MNFKLAQFSGKAQEFFWEADSGQSCGTARKLRLGPTEKLDDKTWWRGLEMLVNESRTHFSMLCWSMSSPSNTSILWSRRTSNLQQRFKSSVRGYATFKTRNRWYKRSRSLAIMWRCTRWGRATHAMRRSAVLDKSLRRRWALATLRAIDARRDFISGIARNLRAQVVQRRFQHQGLAGNCSPLL